MSTIATKPETALNRTTAGSIELGRNGLVISSMDQAMEFAKLMAIMKEAVPKHCRDNAGICLAICIQAYEWEVNPIALAAKSYVVNDRLCWESSIYQSIVIRRAPIVGRIKMEFAGDGPTRTCRVWAELSDGTGIVDYTSQKFGSINPKNSPLWKNDPDQQLFYSSVRAFARRHFPDVMAGIYTADEMVDAVEAVRVVESRPKVERLAERLIQTPEVQVTPEAPQEPVKRAATADVRSFIDRIESAETAMQCDQIADDADIAHAKGQLSAEDRDFITQAFQSKAAGV